MFKWLAEFYEIRRENKLAVQCASCEVLKVELAAERREKQMLLNRILNPNDQTQPANENRPEPVLSKHIPWRVKQQELEAQDRAVASRIKKEFDDKIPTAKVSENIAKMEREMGISDAG